MNSFLQRLKLSRASQVSIGLAVLGLVSTAVFITSKADRSSVAADLNRQGAKRESGLFHPTTAQWAALKVKPVERRAFRSEVLTEGKVAIDEDRATRIFSPYGGRLTKLLAGSGDAVQQGQLLFVIEASDSVETQKDFIAALGSLNKARSQVNLTTVIERRLGSLYKEKAMALKDWEEAQANLTAAKNDLRSAEIALQAGRNRLRLLGKTDAEVDTFEKTGDISPDAPVYAPLSGTILQRKVGPGQYVNAGASDSDPVFVVGDVSQVWLVAYVRELDADRVKVGQTVRFTVLTLPGRVFEAKLSYVASSLDSGSRRLLVRALVDNSEGRLKPEMFASARIAIDETAPTAAVPRDAIIYEGSDARVWVVRDGGGIELRHIKTGLANGEMVQVLNGLVPDEKIIAGGSLFIDRAVALGS